MTTELFVEDKRAGLEGWVLEHVCQPLLEMTPRSVAPNAITLLNHALAWGVFALAVIAPKLDPVPRALALCLAGVGTFGTMVLDCLDGMQARRTLRSSKLGELLDHGLDAIHIPLATGGLCFALNLEPWQAAIVLVTSAMVYNAQLVLYHWSKEFVPPPTSGVAAQLGVSLGYVALAALPDWVRAHSAFGPMVAGACVLATISQLRICGFFYTRLRRHPGAMRGHVSFIVLALAFAAIHLEGLVDRGAFVLLATSLSFRLTGTYVLRTILGQSFQGFDAWALVWLVMIVAIALLSSQLGLSDPELSGPQLAAYAACVHLAVRGLLDVVRNRDGLASTSARAS
ncbi:MAG: CDP-alcohol phosphatidyltransferase family protein [Deltaproteobacteria bacterium]|nr:CDP-alcohol phosphatidyltransferase family protein [Deltaproteobacteria bacterium]